MMTPSIIMRLLRRSSGSSGSCDRLPGVVVVVVIGETIAVVPTRPAARLRRRQGRRSRWPASVCRARSTRVALSCRPIRGTRSRAPRRGRFGRVAIGDVQCYRYRGHELSESGGGARHGASSHSRRSARCYVEDRENTGPPLLRRRRLQTTPEGTLSSSHGQRRAATPFTLRRRKNNKKKEDRKIQHGVVHPIVHPPRHTKTTTDKEKLVVTALHVGRVGLDLERRDARGEAVGRGRRRSPRRLRDSAAGRARRRGLALLQPFVQLERVAVRAARLRPLPAPGAFALLRGLHDGARAAEVNVGLARAAGFDGERADADE
mmetsp:Transcript_15616/g.62882  ORF Transcript_15616/g.62882 Transcript_15616/m.62882 type:complete len:319 (-) Transcript_15616:956-1912(-)